MKLKAIFKSKFGQKSQLVKIFPIDPQFQKSAQLFHLDCKGCPQKNVRIHLYHQGPDYKASRIVFASVLISSFPLLEFHFQLFLDFLLLFSLQKHLLLVHVFSLDSLQFVVDFARLLLVAVH